MRCHLRLPRRHRSMRSALQDFKVTQTDIEPAPGRCAQGRCVAWVPFITLQRPQSPAGFQNRVTSLPPKPGMQTSGKAAGTGHRDNMSGDWSLMGRNKEGLLGTGCRVHSSRKQKWGVHSTQPGQGGEGPRAPGSRPLKPVHRTPRHAGNDSARL